MADPWQPLKDAIKRLLGLEIFPKEVFERLTDEEKGQAFTIARLISEDAIDAARKSLADLLTVEPGREIVSVRDWRTQVWDGLAEKFGKAGASAPAYIDLVFRQTTQTSNAAGKYARIFQPERVRLKPYVKYLAVGDHRTRPAHRALHGKIFLKMDPAARRYYPPNGFNCRCTLRELTRQEVEAKGLAVMDGAEIAGTETSEGEPIGSPPEGFNADRVLALVPKALKDLML